MALLDFSVFSHECGGRQPVSVVLPAWEKSDAEIPNGTKFPVLWLLHGGGGDNYSFTSNTMVERWAVEKKMAVVMPSVGRCHYTDWPDRGNFFSYLANELPCLLGKYLPLSCERADNFVCGISAGGLGAAKLAYNYPEKYACVGVMSIGPAGPGPFCARLPDDDPLKRRLMSWYGGDLGKADGTVDDIWFKMRLCAQRSEPAPELFACCGIDDFAYPGFCDFRHEVERLGLPATFREGPGAHTWDYWNSEFPLFFDWLFGAQPGAH